jgi:DNA polymerase III epsilon subunit-like protein
MANTLIFDTETTGLPNNGKRIGGYNGVWPNPSSFKLYDSSRLVQIAWSVHTPDGELVSKECLVIKPDGFTIGNSQFHGITTEKAMTSGINFSEVYDKLKDALTTVDTIVAHNSDFDTKIVQAEMYRYRLPELIVNKKTMCTMNMGKSKFSLSKLPNLSELYRKCFGKDPVTQLHRADNDTEICAQIYFHILRTGVIGQTLA